jgi:hypothetical protein
LGTDPVTGHFAYQTLGTDYFLAPGTYIIGGEYLGNNDPVPVDAIGVNALSGYAYVRDQLLQGGGLNFPAISVNNYGSNGLLAVDFSVAPVPEPSSVLLLVTLLVGVGLTLKRSLPTQ